jgi:hypothetical protein
MRIHNSLLVLVYALLFAPAAWPVADSNRGESVEIKFQASAATDLAWPLKAKAEELESPVAIYEYVRNQYEFALYHGARSGSINTFLGMRGNDVDLAATLIALLRAKGYAARYAVGNVRLPSAKVANWLAVENIDLAHGLLRNQGIQSVSLAADKSTFTFEHVWVEALVPYGNYRGAGVATVDCLAAPSACNWIALDPSFKQRVHSNSPLDPYKGTKDGAPVPGGAVQFDYDAYYKAVKNGSAGLLNKNPVEIYQNQILAWLQTNAPGKTLADIPDFGGIEVVTNELLPASLPFAVVSAVRRYNSIADHDEAEQSPGTAVAWTEAKKWIKYVAVTPLFGTGDNLVAPPAGTVRVDLVTASTRRLAYSPYMSRSTRMQGFRLDGVPEASGQVAFNSTVNGRTVAAGIPVVLQVSMDGAPSIDGSADKQITARYNGTIGGYYVVATGGETSNWTQVHRASQKLLKASEVYKIVFNSSQAGCNAGTGAGCTPYVAASGSTYVAGMPTLLNSPEAMDDLTGGLLEVAANQYYASVRETLSTLDSLNKIKTPIAGFLGVVSSTNQVEYIDGTAFSIQPGGLLIDMKGITASGTWRIDAANEHSNSHFELAGHALSSLEHETWQRLTGFDAISTVRGFQLSLSKPGSFLVNVKRSNLPAENSITAMYPLLGYDANSPAGFARHTYMLWGKSYSAWTSATPGARFAGIRTSVQGLPRNDPMRGVNICQDGCNARNVLHDFKTLYDSLSNAVTALYSNQRDFDLPAYAAYNIVANDWAGHSGFGIGSYSRVDSDTYRFNLREIAPARDGGSYSLKWRSWLGEPNRGARFGVSGNWSAFTVNSLQVTDQAGNPLFFGVNLVSKSTSGLDFYVYPANTMPNGFYDLKVNINYTLGGVAGMLIVDIDPVAVRNGTGSNAAIVYNHVDYIVTVSKNTDLACNGTTYTDKKPSEALLLLKGCFDAQVVNNEIFRFFSGPAGDVQLRALPAGEKQYSMRVAEIRDSLSDKDVAQSWYEYIVPDVLSTTTNIRFSVDLRRERDTASGRYRSLAFEIFNEWTSSASGGFVRHPSVAGATASEWDPLHASISREDP